MKTCVSGRTEIMWNTHRVGVTADNIVRYKASSLTVLRHSLILLVGHIRGMYYFLAFTF